MFILPAQALPTDAVAFPAADWHWLLAPLRLPLTLAATILVFLVVRNVLLARFIPALPKGVPIALAEKAQTTSSWLGEKFSLPCVHAVAEVPLAMRGRNANVRRPEAALAVRPRIEAPLPAIYESETPVSMAKMIMSRHTHRGPTPRRSPSMPASRRPAAYAHTRSASV
jgi:hypothetical protein